MMSDYSKMNYYGMDIDCTMVNDIQFVTLHGKSEANVVAKKVGHAKNRRRRRDRQNRFGGLPRTQLWRLY